MEKEAKATDFLSDILGLMFEVVRIAKDQERRLVALEVSLGQIVKKSEMEHLFKVLKSQGAALMAIDRTLAEFLKMARKAGWVPEPGEPEQGPGSQVN